MNEDDASLPKVSTPGKLRGVTAMPQLSELTGDKLAWVGSCIHVNVSKSYTNVAALLELLHSMPPMMASLRELRGTPEWLINGGGLFGSGAPLQPEPAYSCSHFAMLGLYTQRSPKISVMEAPP